MKPGPGTNAWPRFSVRAELPSPHLASTITDAITARLDSHAWLLSQGTVAHIDDSLFFNTSYLRIDVSASPAFPATAADVEREVRRIADESSPGVVGGIVAQAVAFAHETPAAIAGAPAVIAGAAGAVGNAAGALITPLAIPLVAIAGAVALVIFMWKR